MKEERIRFARWQQIRIKQLTYIINLVLVLSCTALGFTLNFIKNLNEELNLYSKIFFLVGSILLLSSICLAIFLTIIRLENFRITSILALANDRDTMEESKYLRIKSKNYDDKTWNIFIWQMSTFIVGFTFFLILILIELNNLIF